MAKETQMASQLLSVAGQSAYDGWNMKILVQIRNWGIGQKGMCEMKLGTGHYM